MNSQLKIVCVSTTNIYNEQPRRKLFLGTGIDMFSTVTYSRFPSPLLAPAFSLNIWRIAM